ncbi:hypothetical protein Hanom_Chr08g00723661 [Helianthus anomalus]
MNTIIDRVKWFKELKDERKFLRSLKFFKEHKDIFVRDIISWSWIPELRKIAIRREYEVQYFKVINDIKSFPWLEIVELCKLKLINYELNAYNRLVLRFIKREARTRFKYWESQEPKCTVSPTEIDPEMGKYVVMLKYKKPNVLKRTIWVCDPMWLVNMSDKDIEIIFFNKIFYAKEDREQAMQFQRVVRICFAYEIHFGRLWESNGDSWRR